jgi:hypothetical protein
MFAPPLVLLSRAFARKGEGGPSGGATPTGDVEAGTATGARRAIVCLACGHEITRADAAISVAGSHAHTFMNPGGHVFEIACYREAPGTVGAGAPSAEWSWFPGRLWRVALCAACRAHVGWSFTSEADRFFGLVRDRIGESGD